MTKKRKTSRRRINLEIPIVVIIAGLMLVLIRFSDSKLTELMVSDAETLFMNVDHDPDDQMHEDLANKIAEFRPGAYKMIELYDHELTPVIKIQFDDQEDPEQTNIMEYPELADLLLNNEDGHTSIEINDQTEYIYFKWTENDVGEIFLFIIYTYKPIVRNLWVFHLICYLVLFMVCALLMRLSLNSRSDKIRIYEELSDIEDILH